MELIEATRYQIDAEDRMKEDFESGDGVMTDSEILYLTAMENVKAISKKLVIAEMASRVVFYDMGCPKPPKGSMVVNWMTELDNARINNSTNFAQVLTTEQLGPRKGTYPDQIEAANPGYLHDLFRLIGKSKVSYRGTWGEIATEMNRLSKDQAPRPELHLTKHHLRTWFRANKGKVRKTWERPILDENRMQKRVEWCRARKEELQSRGQKFYYCFLDEKWFYVRSR